MITKEEMQKIKSFLGDSITVEVQNAIKLLHDKGYFRANKEGRIYLYNKNGDYLNIE